MLNHQRQNIHHHNLPQNGTIGRIVGLSTTDPYRKCIVLAYPLTDSAIWKGRAMSLGIHTIWVRFLDNQEIQRFSAHWFQGELT